MAIKQEFSNIATQAKGAITNRQIRQIVNLRSDKTHADEANIFIWVLIIISSAYIGFSDFTFYKQVLNNTLSPALANFSAFILTVGTEIAILKLTIRFLRAFFFGWMFKTWWHLGYWVFIAVLGFGANYWSYSISTEGMEILAYHVQNDNQQKTKTPLDEHVKKSTAAIDQQIASIQSNIDKADKTRTKEGVLYWSASQEKRNYSKSLPELQAQRTKIALAATEDWQRQQGITSKKIGSFAAFTSKYGGVAEIARLICIFGLVFYQRRFVSMAQNGELGDIQRHIDNILNNDSPPPPPPPTHRPVKRPPPTNGYNLTENQNSLFKSSPPPEHNPGTSSPPFSVSQCDTDINEQSAATGADQIIMHYLTSINREVANLNNENGSPSTVAGRMVGALKELENNYLSHPGFNPSKSVLEKAQHGIKRASDTLTEHGFFYDHQTLQGKITGILQVGKPLPL